MSSRRVYAVALLGPPLGIGAVVFPVAMMQEAWLPLYFVWGGVYCVVIGLIGAMWVWSNDVGYGRGRPVVLAAVGSSVLAWLGVLVWMVMISFSGVP